MTEGKMMVYEYEPGCVLPRGAVIALGLFDGVHTGHRLLLDTAKRISAQRGLTFSVFTFRAESLKKGGGVLYSTEEKLRLLEGLGVEAVILSDFGTLSGVDASDFAKRLLVTEMGCEVAVCGFDFRFGSGALGDAELLFSLMRECGKSCVIEEEHTLDGEKISTTRIKALLCDGDVGRAREFLGIPYFITARVEHGRGEGRGLGFPTANLTSHGLLHLRRGVYSCIVRIGDKLVGGVANVGTCPTFDERGIHAEVNLIDFEGDLYGEKLEVFFISFLREERRFEDSKALTMQINVDKNRAKTEIGDISWQEIGLR